MQDMPTVRSTPIRVPTSAEVRAAAAEAAGAADEAAPTVISRPVPAAHPAHAVPAPHAARKRPVALFAGIGVAVAAVAVVAALVLGGGSTTETATGGDGAGPAAAAAPVASVLLNPPSASISVNGEANLTAFSADAAGNPLAGRPVVWKSLDTTVVSVAASGVAVGQVRGLRAGQAEVEATVEGKSVRALIKVTTERAEVAQVNVTAPQTSVAAGDSVRFLGAARDRDGNTLADRAVTWASSDSSIARVTRTGMVVTLREGTATITAASEGRRSDTRITVTAARVAEVAVEPTGVSLRVGGVDTLRATPRDSRRNALTGRPVQWQSANQNIATVTAAGVVTARATGSTEITATVDGRTTRVPVTINAVPVAAVAISAPRLELEAGATGTLTVTARDAGGNTLTGRATDWSSSNNDVARVSATGIVTGVAAGTARITGM
jgi:uncharacterized protein YjdB